MIGQTGPRFVPPPRGLRHRICGPIVEVSRHFGELDDFDVDYNGFGIWLYVLRYVEGQRSCTIATVQVISLSNHPVHHALHSLFLVQLVGISLHMSVF